MTLINLLITTCTFLAILINGGNSQTCNGQPYNPNIYICCDGVLNLRGLNSACCGTQGMI